MNNAHDDDKTFYDHATGFYFITESPTPAPSIRVIKEDYSSNPKNPRMYIQAESIFQTVNEVNRNRRKYPDDLLTEAIVSNSEKIKNRTFLGELDHPLDPNPARQATVLYKEASHCITNLKLSGSNIVGIFETLSTTNGKNLFGLIKDGIPIGFSLRAMGELQEMDGYTLVKRPFVMVCYDSVSQPSHQTARIQKIMKEDIQLCIGPECKKQYISSKLNDKVKKVFNI